MRAAASGVSRRQATTDSPVAGRMDPISNGTAVLTASNAAPTTARTAIGAVATNSAIEPVARPTETLLLHGVDRPSMKATGGDDDAKRRAGEHAAGLIEDGMVVGLGTGSTAAHAIRELGRAVEAGLDAVGVATSYQSADLAREVGVPLRTLDDVSAVDVAIDGADQIAELDCIKGGGAAHAREKLVDATADRLVIVADPSKEADRLDRPVPVEILPDARRPVSAALRGIGGEPELRQAERKDGPVVTENGNLVLDCAFGPIEDPDGLAGDLSAVPGVVEHGLFVGLADDVVVGTTDGVETRR